MRREIREIKPTTTSTAIVETRDIAVTIYDYLGLLPHVQKLDPLVNGKSLMPILLGEANSVRKWLDLEHAVVYHDTIHWNAILGYYWDEDSDDVDDTGELLWKYIFHVYDGGEQLFCLTKDPHETYDLSMDKPGVLQHFRETMVTQFEQEERGSEWVRNGRLIVHRPSMVSGPNFPCK